MRIRFQPLVLAGLCLLVAASAVVALTQSPRVRAMAGERQKVLSEARGSARRAAHLDPAAWGHDHVGQELPEYIDSGECLFCHRNDIGPSWTTNKHSQTIRDAVKESPVMKALAGDPKTATFAEQVELVMGDTRAIRFLKRAEGFGRLDLLTAAAVPGRGSRYHIEHAQQPRWDGEAFAGRCAGCHCTGIEPDTHAFTTASLDCYVCHGDGPLDHSTDTKLMPLAKARHDSPTVVTSICAQCHIRFGKSKTSGLPYPNNFVAGDNLFKDFAFDWNLADDAQLNPGDRHVIDNIRAVALAGDEQFTCLSCHQVHSGSSVKHRDLPDVTYCQHCHEPGKPKKEHKHYEVHSTLCEY